MATLTYRVRYADRFGHALATIAISLNANELQTLHLAVADAGDKAFGKAWARAVVMGGLRLTVDKKEAV